MTSDSKVEELEWIDERMRKKTPCFFNEEILNSVAGLWLNMSSFDQAFGGYERWMQDRWLVGFRRVRLEKELFCVSV